MTIFFYKNNLSYPTDKSVSSDSSNTPKIESNNESVNLAADLAIKPNQQPTSSNLDLIYIPNGDQEISAITLRLILKFNQTNMIKALQHFALDSKLKGIGFTDHINSFNCPEPLVCQLDIALIKLNPDKWSLNENTEIGSIIFDKDFDTNNLNIQIDQTETKALTTTGKSITINLQK